MRNVRIKASLSPFAKFFQANSCSIHFLSPDLKSHYSDNGTQWNIKCISLLILHEYFFLLHIWGMTFQIKESFTIYHYCQFSKQWVGPPALQKFALEWKDLETSIVLLFLPLLTHISRVGIVSPHCPSFISDYQMWLKAFWAWFPKQCHLSVVFLVSPPNRC